MSVGADALVSFWSELPQDRPPFIHPRDVLPRGSYDGTISSFADWKRRFLLGDLSRSTFHVNLPPLPYTGDLANAEIVLLLTNPGFDPGDYHAYETDKVFRDMTWATLRQEVSTNYQLDPCFGWTPAFRWWEGKVRKIAEIIATERFGGRYGAALTDLARRICAVEQVPYRSQDARIPSGLRSSEEARRFVRSLSDDRTIIVLRSARGWSVPPGPNVVTYTSGQARGASLGPTTPGGMAILRAFGID